jgi:1-deoxy-D-xylulose-5-phosphate synthase
LLCGISVLDYLSQRMLPVCPKLKSEGPDLSSLSVAELYETAQEVRQRIVSVVSANGGHLAASLGVVELTVALLAAFKVPDDKIIWDVGHQSYAYKILAGRRDSFHTLRQDHGISGFPSRAESAFDAFGTGHASTSISAAIGVAKARDLRHEDFGVVAVIGDGAFTGGIAWEALNNVGDDGTDILVILNDNGMSISPSNGALATHISQIRTQSLCRNLDDTTKYLLGKVKVGGPTLKRLWEELGRGLTSWVSPKNGTLFEALGFTYIGPVDGHNISLLKSMLVRTKRLKGPVLLHVVTKKGKGYKYAEKDAQVYHGVGTFSISNGKSEHRNQVTYSNVFGDAMVEIAGRQSDVCAITAAMPDGTGLSEFAKRFPDRFFNVGIAEEHAVTFAAGLATGGQRPVVAIYSTFLQRAYDQIVHDVCLQNLPVVFAVDRAGIVGEDGATHQGAFDIAFLRHIPNMVVMSPATGNELRSMLHCALSSGRPCAIRYPRDVNPGEIAQDIQPIEIGRSELLREGTDAVLIALGGAVGRCIESARLLEQEGISAAVINARFVKPIDEDMLRQVSSRFSAIVTVEEHIRQCGFGSAVLEALNQLRLSSEHLLTIALPDEFIAHGRPETVRSRCNCTATAIAERTKEHLLTVHATPAEEMIGTFGGPII